MGEHRQKRVESLVRDQISAMIMKGVVKDPRVDSMLSITEVTVSKDFGYADIYVSSIESDESVEAAVEGLNHAAGFLRHRLRENVRLRTIPELRFKRDPSIKSGFLLSQKLKDISPDS